MSNRYAQLVETHYLDERLVFLLSAKNRDEALQSLVDALVREKKIKDKDAFLKAIFEREKIVSTGIGMGVAIPHAKLSTLSDFFIAVGIQRGPGLEWDSIDQSLVKIIFMIGGPDSRQTEYLRILSMVTFLIRDVQLRRRILSLNSTYEIARLLKERLLK